MSDRVGGRIVLVLAATLASLALLSARALDDLSAAPRDDQRRFDFDGDSLSVVARGDGRVRITPGREKTLSVGRELSGAAAREGNSAWSMEGDTLRLSARCTGLEMNCRAEFVIRVPRGVDVSVRASAGVTTLDIHSRARITTQTGDIKIEGATGSLWLHSTSGRIEVLDSTSQTVEAHTARAPVSLSFTAPPQRVVVGSEAGDIRVDLPDSPARYRIIGTARDGESWHIGVVDVPSADRRIVARTEEGAVRIHMAES
ncbi:DUF4097 family beta strand repeat-containing protein [Streptomyces sp. CAS3]